MRLLIAIINNPDYVIDILSEFYQVGVKGSTVLDSMGMAHLIAPHVSFFSRFAEFGQEPAHNKTIFVVVESEEDLQKAINAIEKIVGDLEKPDTGFVMTLPIDFCKGLNKIGGKDSVR